MKDPVSSVIVTCAVFTIQDKADALKTWFFSPRLCWPERGHPYNRMEVHEIPCFRIIPGPSFVWALAGLCQCLYSNKYSCVCVLKGGRQRRVWACSQLGFWRVPALARATVLSDLQSWCHPCSQGAQSLTVYLFLCPQPSTQRDVRNYKMRRRIWRGA